MFHDAEHHCTLVSIKLYGLMTEADVQEQTAEIYYIEVQWWESIYNSSIVNLVP